MAPAEETATDSDAYRKLYVEGGTIPLKLHDVDGAQTRTVTAKILKLHQPFTLSCVLTVELPGQELGSAEQTMIAVLKLYDRRSAAQLREDEEIDLWTEEKEDAFLEFVSTGQATEFVSRLNDKNDDFEEPEEGWSPAENETYLHNKCADFYATETRAYELLGALQGKQIPKLYSRVSMSLACFYQGDSRSAQFYKISGILLEYIPGPTLSDLVDSSIPRDKWQLIVDKAVQVVRDYAELGIRNKDVRPSNFIVTDDDEHRVVMIDLAICEFRKPGQSEFDWGKAKWSQDEEGAIGVVMQMRTRKVGFELEFTQSSDWIEYMPGPDE